MAALRARTRHQRLAAVARQLAGVGVVAVLTVVLAQSTTTAAFTASTADTGNVVGAAATFCSVPGTTSAGIPVRDASTNGSGTNGNTVYNGTTNPTGTSTGGDGYYYIRFDMPPVPSRCKVTSATLALFAGTGQPATMVVQRAATTWSDTTLTWNNQPTLTGSPTSLTVAGTGWHSYSVGGHVTAFLAAPTSNHGFVVRDQLTLGGAISAYRYQIYNSFSNASNSPTLTITWG